MRVVKSAGHEADAAVGAALRPSDPALLHYRSGAFYLARCQQAAPPRDGVPDVLLGLVAMGLFFDLLGVRNALDEMRAVFARNLEMFAELAEQLLVEDHIKAIKRIRRLRDQINDGFQAVTAQSDAVLLDFSLSRQQKLQIRKNIQRWPSRSSAR